MTPDPLSRSHVLVVGGSAGMGFAIARLARERGATVTIAARNPDKLAAAAARLGPDVRPLPVDTTDEASVRALFAQAGEVDHLLIPGTTLKLGPWKTMPVADVEFSLRGKFVGPFLCARHARIKPGGSLTFWSGIISRRPGQNDALLAGVNAAVEAMAKALAKDLAPVRVNCVSPGLVAGTDAYLALPEAAREGMYAAAAKKLPVGRVGAPEHVASLALEIAVNPFVTGTVVDVDGGGLIV